MDTRKEKGRLISKEYPRRRTLIQTPIRGNYPGKRNLLKTSLKICGKSMSGFYFKENFAKALWNIGIIPSHKLAEVLDALKTKSEAVSTILDTMQIISEKEFHTKLSSQTNIPFMSLRDSNIPQEVLTLVSPELNRDLLVIPNLERS